MATTPQQRNTEDSLRDEVRQQASEFATLKIEALLKKDVAGGAYNLEQARPYLEIIARVTKALQDADLRNAGENALRGALNSLTPIRNQIQAVRNFNPTNSSNPGGERNNLISNLKTIASDAFNNIGQFVSMCNISRSSSYEEQAQAALDTLRGTIGTETRAALEHQTKAQAEINEILDAAKKATQSIGIVAHSKFFQEESRSHQRSATVWLVVTLILAITAVYLGWWNYSHTLDALTQSINSEQQKQTWSIQIPQGQAGQLTPKNESTNIPLQIQLAVAKLIIFSVLFSAVVWSGRMYRAHRHNFVINRHRLNALNTFEAFAKATDDQQIKNAVLLQATQCIFGPQPTGYISGESENDGSPQILEIVRSIGGDKAK